MTVTGQVSRPLLGSSYWPLTSGEARLPSETFRSVRLDGNGIPATYFAAPDGSWVSCLTVPCARARQLPMVRA